MQQKKNDSPRAQAAKIISRWFREDVFPDRLVRRIEKGTPFIMEVVFGIIRRQSLLDAIARNLISEKPDPLVRGIVYCGLYELLFMDSEPDHAVIHDTVENAKPLVGSKRSGFVNAVLRSAQRQKGDILSWTRRLPLHVQHSHPEELFFRWKKQYGQLTTLRIMEWNNEPPRLTITLNLKKTNASAFIRQLAEAGIEAEPHLFNRSRCLIIPRGVRVGKIPGFEEGLFFVQDPAATIAPGLLDPQPGMNILDACAAPGGKTMLLADQIGNDGVILALDREEERLPWLEENIARVGATCVKTGCADASEPASLEQAAKQAGIDGFDAVLADVPCSNTGVIRRRPEARWRFNEEHFNTVIQRQAAILDGTAAVVKPGGRLVYSTCSMEAEENENQVDAFLARNDSFKKISDRRILPQVKQTDGAYAALLEKSSA